MRADYWILQLLLGELWHHGITHFPACLLTFVLESALVLISKTVQEEKPSSNKVLQFLTVGVSSNLLMQKGQLATNENQDNIKTIQKY